MGRAIGEGLKGITVIGILVFYYKGIQMQFWEYLVCFMAYLLGFYLSLDD